MRKEVNALNIATTQTAEIEAEVIKLEEKVGAINREARTLEAALCCVRESPRSDASADGDKPCHALLAPRLAEITEDLCHVEGVIDRLLQVASNKLGSLRLE
jgi:hypothetical protein